MESRQVIVELAEVWVGEPPVGGRRTVATAEGAIPCEICATTDLLLAGVAADWSHEVIHGLVAPIEEVVADAVERYLATDRERRLGRVDRFHSHLRTSARAVVDRALMERIAGSGGRS